MDYEIFDPKIDRPLHELSRAEAQIAYDWFISNISVRLEQISLLLAADGILLDFTHDSLAKLQDWFFEVVSEEREFGNSRPSPELFSVCNDIGIYFSEIVIRSSRNVNWLFYTKDKRELFYQHPVISGFNVKNRNYHINFDYIICQYAFRIIESGAKEYGVFVEMIDEAMSLV